MSHIFISYSHKDKAYVHRLQEALQDEGFDAWIDDRIDYGDHWLKVIQKHLDECDAFIIVMSGNSFESDMVQNEITRAREKRKPVFPLLLEGESWLIVQARQYVDVRDGSLPSEKFYKRLESVTTRKKAVFSSPPPPSPNPPAPKGPLITKDTFTRFKTEVSPVVRVLGVIALLGMMVWAGSLAIPAIGSLIATASTATIQPSITSAPASKTAITPTQTQRPIPSPTKTQTPAPTALQTVMTDAKGVTMRLVPASEFTMGSDNGNSDEKPTHQLFVKAFYIDQYEVTNGLYKACVDAGVCDAPSSISYGNAAFDNYPVGSINWFQANSYCEWRGMHLPSEAQWEKAARGKDGNIYPWGNEFRCEFMGNSSGCTQPVMPVGSFENGRSIYGVHDLIGNVWEWVESLYMPYPYVENDGREDLRASGNRVVRGGYWSTTGGNKSYASYRNSADPKYTADGIGFRCAEDTP